MSGKGSRPRPFSVDRKTFEENWDRIFSNKTKENSPIEVAIEGQRINLCDDVEDVDLRTHLHASN